MNHHHHRLPHGHLPHAHPPHARLPHARLRARPSPARLSPTRPSPIPPPSAGPPSMHPPSARPPATAPPLGNPRPCTTGPSSTYHPRAPPSLPRPRPATTTAGPRRPTSKRQNTTTMVASPRFGGARTASAPASSSSSWWRSWERSLSDVPSFLFFSFFYIFALSRPESAIKGACIRIYISAFVPPHTTRFVQIIFFGLFVHLMQPSYISWRHAHCPSPVHSPRRRQLLALSPLPSAHACPRSDKKRTKESVSDEPVDPTLGRHLCGCICLGAQWPGCLHVEQRRGGMYSTRFPLVSRRTSTPIHHALYQENGL